MTLNKHEKIPSILFKIILILYVSFKIAPPYAGGEAARTKRPTRGCADDSDKAAPPPLARCTLRRGRPALCTCRHGGMAAHLGSDQGQAPRLFRRPTGSFN